jgi:steroid delta-isomerase-like uncharacterized protein
MQPSASAVQDQPPAPVALPERNKQIVRALYEDCLNRGRLDRLPELVASDFEGLPGKPGLAGFRSVIEDLRSGFPDIHYTIDDMLAEGDRVAIRWTWEGTHDGQFRVFARSGKRHRNSGIAIYEVRDGKIVKTWLETDRLGHLQQLGVVPKDIATRPPPKAD